MNLLNPDVDYPSLQAFLDNIKIRSDGRFDYFFPWTVQTAPLDEAGNPIDLGVDEPPRRLVDLQTNSTCCFVTKHRFVLWLFRSCFC